MNKDQGEKSIEKETTDIYLRKFRTQFFSLLGTAQYVEARPDSLFNDYILTLVLTTNIFINHIRDDDILNIIKLIVTNNFKNHKGFSIINDIDELGYNHPKNFKNIPKSELISNGKELIKINNKLSDLQKIICNYWEGNNDKQIKKINIEGHWFSILSQKIKNSSLSTADISKLYAILGLTVNEAYKIGEYEEYKTTYISPNVIIKNNLDKNWDPYLKNNINEFNSITSVVSLSASNIISNYLKDNSPFIDSSIYKYTGQVRNYSSLEEAASEASISRAYGGVHYIFTVNEAAGQGKYLASKILNKIK